ncbi:hypothetical protein CQW23_13866 [Capsicum baccatum]|uniref:TF-B3 domain-containing protein n=1 Tax=Capsicum baccatum TaxID=33114 RepID=A0A2G2WHI1_CAPBA|nr:hypothetical protein CQW23_13866 [Capsicum baccatum]
MGVTCCESAFSKHLKGINQEHAILRRAGKKWRVKVNGRLLGEGWAKFVEEHDLQLGDLLIFRHEGAMEFEVSIFDSNQFEREYEQTPEGVNEAGEEINHNCKFTSQDLRANASNASLQPEGKKPNLDDKRVSSRRKEANVLASTSANADSQFVTIIKPYAVIRALVYLPSAFARPNGLMRRCKMILRDEKQRSWSVQLGSVGPRFGITRGWRQFREANAVQLGDTYKFELIDNGTIPVAYFCYILRDEKQRSWPMLLVPMGHHVAISRGWRQLREANNVQIGDPYKVELVKNGIIPIAVSHCKYSGKEKSAAGDVQGKQV